MLLYEHYETDKLMICLDPSNIELLRDFSSDRSELRILEVDVDFDDAYVLGHAKRVVLVAENTPVGTLVGLLPSVKNDLRYELEALRDSDFANYFRLVQGNSVTRNGEALASFANMSTESAQSIASKTWMFND